MNNSSRRRFIGVAGAGAAAVGASAVIPGAAFASETRRRDGSTESVVAHVDDVRSGSLTLYVGEREVVVHDRDLVNRLLNAAGK